MFLRSESWNNKSAFKSTIKYYIEKLHPIQMLTINVRFELENKRIQKLNQTMLLCIRCNTISREFVSHTAMQVCSMCNVFIVHEKKL